MEGDDRQYGQRAETINVRSIAREVTHQALVCQFHLPIDTCFAQIELQTHLHKNLFVAEVLPILRRSSVVLALTDERSINGPLALSRSIA